jgi:hypothetical protein
MAEEVACVSDKIFEWTTSINNFFRDNVGAKNAFIIISGLFMDIMVLT